MIPRDVLPLVVSFCDRQVRVVLGYDYDTCIQRRIHPCRLALHPDWVQPLLSALMVRTELDNEVFIYDADEGRALYFAMYGFDDYEYAVTTKTALTTPKCGEWIVWQGGVERIMLMREGRAATFSSTVSRSYCFELGQLPTKVIWNGQTMSVNMYWSKV